MQMNEIKKKLQGLFYPIRHKRIFKKVHGYNLDLENPITWNEKINHRKRYGDKKKMALIADKYRVRDYVQSIVGKEVLIPLLGVYDKIEDVDCNALPDNFVIKTNHGSGSEHISIVSKKSGIDINKLREKFNRALKDNFGENMGEYFYQEIDRKIIIEEYLVSGSFTPNDYKFHCFNNGTETKIYIQVDEGRYTDHKRSIFDEEWVELDITINPKYKRIIDKSRPKNLDEMISIARKLSSEFSYIRVDLYSVNGKVYFGELTQTHGNGMEKILPYKVDVEWGNLWVYFNKPQGVK